MEVTNLLIYILFLHFVADFILQSDEIAKKKSKDWKVLGKHVGIYGLTLFDGLMVWNLFNGNPVYQGLLWIGLYALVNSAAHFVTDAVTSRVNARLYAAGWIHEFFVGIGLDQFIHAATLLATLRVLGVI